MSLWSRIRAAIDSAVEWIVGDIEVTDVRGAEKQPARKKPPTASKPRQKPLEPRPMPPGYEDAVDIGDLVRQHPRNIGEFTDDYDQEWLYTWDLMPTGDMSDNQIETAINMIRDQLETADWQDIWDDMVEDFWTWYRERYTS